MMIGQIVLKLVINLNGLKKIIDKAIADINARKLELSGDGQTTTLTSFTIFNNKFNKTRNIFI